MSRFERPLRIVKRFGELLKRGPSGRDVATSDAGTQAVCLVHSSSTQTATCSPRLKALQQLNSSYKSQSQPSASHQNQSISTQSSSSASNAASASFFHPNIRVPPAGRPNPIPILPRYSSKYQMHIIKTMLNSSPHHKPGNDPHDHLRPATAIVSAAAPSPVTRLANHAKSFALTPGLNYK